MLSDKKTLQRLKEIMFHEYGAVISDDQVQELGTSLLRIARVALVALTRVEEKKLQQKNNN